jgi:hypothetical protein
MNERGIGEGQALHRKPIDARLDVEPESDGKTTREAEPAAHPSEFVGVNRTRHEVVERACEGHAKRGGIDVSHIVGRRIVVWQRGQQRCRGKHQA